jgi:uncharacterized membrane protein
MANPSYGRAFVPRPRHPEPGAPPTPPAQPNGYRQPSGYGQQHGNGYQYPAGRAPLAPPPPRNLERPGADRLGIVEPRRLDRGRPRRVRHRDDDKRAIHWLLAIPIALPLLVPLYNRVDPKIAGIPFFYWYQMFTGVIAIVVLTFLYQVTKDRR